MMPVIRRLSMSSKLFGLIAAALPATLAVLAVTLLALGFMQLGSLRRASAFVVNARSSHADDHQVELLKSIWAPGANQGLAGAALERKIGDTLRINRLEQKSMEIVSTGDNSITVNVSAAGNVAGLRRTLYALETGTPFIFVKSLEVHRQEETPAEVAASDSTPLAIQMVLQAFPKGENS